MVLVCLFAVCGCLIQVYACPARLMCIQTADFTADHLVPACLFAQETYMQ